MPELPEVEVVKQSLEKYILNESLLKIVIKNKKLRFPIPVNLSKKLSKKNILNVKRFSKYVVIEFKNELFLLIHLGMSGTLHLTKNLKYSKNTNLSFYHSKNLPKNLNDVVATNDKFFSSFLNKCISEGIYFAPSKFEAGFISTKHTKLEINHTINVIEKILKKGI